MLLFACSSEKSDTPTPPPIAVTVVSLANDSPTPTPTWVPQFIRTTEPAPTLTPEEEALGGEWSPEEASTVWDWLKQNRWDTDFRYRKVNLTEIKSYIFRDRILPIDEPEFSSVNDPPDYMRSDEPVLALTVRGQAKAYPLAILMWHEIVNDVIARKPVAITYCPLCNTAVAFDSTVDGNHLTFGTTGNVRNSDLVMWDRFTESWWQQMTGEAIVGTHAYEGTVLEVIPSTIVPWGRFVEDHPDGLVLNRLFEDNGDPVRSYDTPPYTGYDNSDRRPFAFEGELNHDLIVTSRVLSIGTGESSVVYPFEFLREHSVVNDVVNENPVVALFDPNTASSFRDYEGVYQPSGSATAFSRVVNGQVLTFELGSPNPINSAPDDTSIVFTDKETDSVWTLSGKAIAGPMTGNQLTQIAHGNDFWFAIALFWPETEIRDSIADLTP